MKRFLTVLLIGISLAAGAQNERLVKELAGDGSLFCKFAVTGVSTSGSSISGKAWIQDESYRIEADTFQIICNGKTRWFYNASSDELVVENNDLSFLENPLEKLSDGSYRMTVKMQGGAVAIVSVHDIRQQKERYSFEYFMMDPEKISLDTIVTDLR